MKRAAIISAILDKPQDSQRAFNDIISEYHDIVRGRMGIPFGQGKIALVSLTVVAELDRINSLTGRLGKLDGVTVKASVAKEGIILE
ncbi:MAG: TM1266 family iron-only hydrogenase system putative regulator [Clostridiaceae bacterium]